jgi:sugar phosphate isomerase/epimerase
MKNEESGGGAGLRARRDGRAVVPITRRAFLAASAVGAGLTLRSVAAAEPAPVKTGAGVALAGYSIRSRVDRAAGFNDPVKFLEFCAARGAGGAQLPIGVRDDEYVKRLRRRAEELSAFVESSIRTPRDETDVERFQAEVRSAVSAGVTMFRTVMLGGRRYETFKTTEEYAEFQRRSLASIRLAEPVMGRHKVKLAVENHKDYRTDELLDVMKRVSSEHVGVCLDTGNNIALMEDPAETIAALAPWTINCHLKDMAVEESADGFLLSEVVLGEGIIDLAGTVERLRKARPGIRFHTEMLTRDPLRVPVLTDGYWATFGGVPGRDLARTLAFVRKHAKGKLPRVSGLPEAEQLALEDRWNRQCLEYAGRKLGL